MTVLSYEGRGMTQAQRDIKGKLKLLEYAKEIGNISKACRYFGISRQSFYQWRQALAEKGEEGRITASLFFNGQQRLKLSKGLSFLIK